MNELAPIALFAYKRLDHSRQTIEALQANHFASDSNLVIFADAARVEEDREAVGLVREYLKTVTGFRSVRIVERETNLGLANSIIDGVSSILEEFGKIIVMEDDLITSPHFLAYMNDALKLYEKEERVMHISGYMFPLANAMTLPSSFFYRATTCWGWATWQRAWKNIELNSEHLLAQIKQRKLEKEFDILGSYQFTEMLEEQSRGLIDSWAIRWYASVFLHQGLCLHPSKSLVSNIGLDGSGEHCGSIDFFSVDAINAPEVVLERCSDINESRQGLSEIVAFNRSLILPIHTRVLNKINRMFSHFQGKK